MNRERRIMIIAGEVSGDMHAANLVRALRRCDPNLQFFGIGGDRMRDEGVDLFQHERHMSVMGLSEVLRRFSFFRRVFAETVAILRNQKPDALILVDYPGFNLRLAARAHALGIKVIYYICPQVWAWNRARIPRMARMIDRLLTIFPFEPDVFAGTGLRVDFVGHPLVDEARAARTEPGIDLPWAGSPRVALLPGSRAHEIRRILPVMRAAAEVVASRCPSASFLVASPSAAIAEIVRTTLADAGGQPARWSVVTGCTRQVLRQADAAFVASGTATIEASLMECPMAVVYRVGALTWLIGRLLVRLDHIGMVNIVAGRRLCPEFIQSAATPQAMADALMPLLSDTPARQEMQAGLRRVNELMGEGGAAERAAACVMQELSSVPTPEPVTPPRVR